MGLDHERRLCKRCVSVCAWLGDGLPGDILDPVASRFACMVSVAQMLRWSMPPSAIFMVLLIQLTHVNKGADIGIDFAELFGGEAEISKALRQVPGSWILICCRPEGVWMIASKITIAGYKGRRFFQISGKLGKSFSPNFPKFWKIIVAFLKSFRVTAKF